MEKRATGCVGAAEGTMIGQYSVVHGERAVPAVRVRRNVLVVSMHRCCRVGTAGSGGEGAEGKTGGSGW